MPSAIAAAPAVAPLAASVPVSAAPDADSDVAPDAALMLPGLMLQLPSLSELRCSTFIC